MQDSHDQKFYFYLQFFPNVPRDPPFFSIRYFDHQEQLTIISIIERFGNA